MWAEFVDGTNFLQRAWSVQLVSMATPYNTLSLLLVVIQLFFSSFSPILPFIIFLEDRSVTGSVRRFMTTHLRSSH